MKNLVSIFLLISVTGPALWARDSVENARQAWEAAPVHALTWMGRWVDRHLLKEKEIGTLAPSEVTFIKNNPDAAMVIQNSACRSLAISYALCGVDARAKEFSRAWDEEADAVRHFIFSSFLACSRGREFAEFYTIAHEGPPTDWEAPSFMDIHNNYVAFDWASSPADHCLIPLSDERMAKTALRLIAEGQLVTLRKGDTECSDPTALLKRDWTGFTDEVNLVQRDLQEVLPTCKPGFHGK